MFKKTLCAVVLAGLLSTGASAQDAKTVISNVSKAMGADNLRSVAYSGSGFDFVLGQNYGISSPWPKFIVKTYTRVINFESPAHRTDRIRMQGENPPRGGGQQPVQGEQPQNQTVVVGPNTPWAQQLDIVMTPYGFLRAASAANPTISARTAGGRKYNVVTFIGQNKAAVNGYINEQNMVERVETTIDNAFFGDMTFESVYSDYKDFAGVKFPTRIIQRQAGHPILDLTITDVKPNAPANIQPPQGRGGAPAAAAAGGGAAAPAGLPTQKLDEGVYLILGGYASIVFDFKDHIVVLEGPQSEERGSAVIAEAKRLIPNKPIRYVVNTHAHIDHSSGLRAFVAEGATIVTHQANRPYFEKLFANPHSLNPDKMALSKRKPSFETVGSRKVLTDGNHVIELHHMTNFGHHEGALIAYLPKLKILYQADAYNPPAQANAPPPAAVSPYNAALVATIERLKLDVDRIIPVHYPGDNRVVTRGELIRMVGKSGS